MKEDTKIVISTLIAALKMQNDAMKQMAKQIEDLQKAIEDWDTRMTTPTEIHNHYHNEYTTQRYPYYTPVWGGGTYTINSSQSPPDGGPVPVSV